MVSGKETSVDINEIGQLKPISFKVAIVVFIVFDFARLDLMFQSS